MPWEIDGACATYEGELVLVIARNVDIDEADNTRASKRTRCVYFGAGLHRGGDRGVELRRRDVSLCLQRETSS